MDLTTKTPATETSIDVDLVKANKRIRHASEDDLIRFWIAAADAYVEKRTNCALMRQTFVLRLRRVIPAIYLPRPPFASLVAAKYTIDGRSEVVLNVNTDVSTRLDAMLTVLDISALGTSVADGTMEIEYTAGAETPEDVPMPLRLASLQLASHYMTSREAAYMDPRLMNVEKKIAFGVDEQVKEFRVPNLNEQPNDAWA